MDAGLLQEKALVNWNCAGGDPYPMEKNLREIPMFAVFPERGLALPTSDFFWGMLDFYKIEHVHLNPNLPHLCLCPFLRSFSGHQAALGALPQAFHLKPQPNAKMPHAVGGAGIQMLLKAKEQ